MQIAHEIETLIRARYPLLYVVTSEETRVCDLVQEIATRRQKKAYEWSYSTGGGKWTFDGEVFEFVVFFEWYYNFLGFFLFWFVSIF